MKIPPVAVGAVAFGFLALTPSTLPQERKSAKTQPKGDDSFFTGPPFTLNDLLQRIGVIADKRLGTAVERRGIDFSPSPADLDKLKAAGAGVELIRTITSKAPPPPKPPPAPPPAAPPAPPARAGRIILECVPPECDVAVNGKARGSTAGGVIELRDLAAGKNVIDFRKDGFEGQQLVLSLTAGAATTQTINLRPTGATRARAGKILLDRMVQKLGGRPALQQAALVVASGNATLFRPNGQRTEWQMTARLKLPSMAMIEISGARLRWWTSLSGDDSRSGGTRQMTGGPIAREMEKLVRVYRDYQLAILVERFQGMRLSTQTVVLQTGQWQLRAGDSDGAFQMFIDPDYTPRRVVYDSTSGLGGGMEVLYSDYATVGSTWYPKSMSIKFSARPQQGLELRFSEVKFVDKLADKEFHR